jgi:hypothetical protein
VVRRREALQSVLVATRAGLSPCLTPTCSSGRRSTSSAAPRGCSMGSGWSAESAPPPSLVRGGLVGGNPGWLGEAGSNRRQGGKGCRRGCSLFLFSMFRVGAGRLRTVSVTADEVLHFCIAKEARPRNRSPFRSSVGDHFDDL